MQHIITPYDFLLLPVYLLFFWFLVKKRAEKYKGQPLYNFFITAFVLRMLGSIVYCFIVQYYYGYGDTFGYYLGGDVISDMIKTSPSNLQLLFTSGKSLYNIALNAGYGDAVPITMPEDSNVFIMKASAIISFITFDRYMIISLFFGFFSFIGIWKLFYVLNEVNKRRNSKLLAIAVLYMPSCCLYGSGLLKEPICLGTLGITIYLSYKTFVLKKYSLQTILLIFLNVAILTIIKNYISILLSLSLLLSIVYFSINRIRNKFAKIVSFFCLSLVFITAINSASVSDYIQESVQTSFAQIQTFKTSYELAQSEDETSKAGFMLSNVEASVQSIFQHIPEVVGSCLFRPFIWESKKIIIFFAALESFATLMVTLFILYKTKLYGFFTLIFNNKYRFFCFFASIFFAIMLGLTTFNFGTMVRYKIVFLPFYFFMLISMYSEIQLKDRASLIIDT